MKQSSPQFNAAILQAGDCLLYRPSTPFDVVVATGTDAWVSHVEVFYGAGMTLASRNGRGVGRYQLRTDHVAAVLRPGPEFRFDKAMAWYYSLKPKPKYGWLTLLNFAALRNKPQPGHMICSEFSSRFYFAGDYPLFNAVWPFWRTSPAHHLSTRRLSVIWDDRKLFRKL